MSGVVMPVVVFVLVCHRAIPGGCARSVPIGRASGKQEGGQLPSPADSATKPRYLLPHHEWNRTA